MGLFILSLAGRSSAQPAGPPLALTWSAPGGCPQREAFAGWMREHLGAAADPAGYPGVVIHGALTRESASWRLRLRVERDGVRGERVLSGTDCRELARSGALVVAIVLEPGLAGADAPPSTPAGDPPPDAAPVVPAPVVPAPLVPAPATGVPAPATSIPAPATSVPAPATGVPAPAPVVPAPATSVPAPATGLPAPAPVPVPATATGVTVDDEPRPDAAAIREPARRVGHAVRLAAGVEGGLLPGVGGGLQLAYALRLRALRLELTGSVWPARRRDAAIAGVDATALLGAAAVRACPTPRLALRRGGPLEFPLCLGLELGGLDVRADGFDDARRTRALWVAAQVQPGLAWRFSRRFALWGGVALVAPITRAAFTIEPLPELFRVGPVGVRGELGLEVHLGRDPAGKIFDGSTRRR